MNSEETLIKTYPLECIRPILIDELRIPILSEYATKGNTLRDILLKGILYHAQELKGAKAMVDGSLVVEDQPCTSDSIHEVELLLPFMNNSSAEVCSQNEVVGAAIFSGCICSYSYLSPKEPLSQAIADMKGDIIMSLQNRLDIICDDVEGDLDSTIDVSTVESNEISTEKPIPLLVLQLLREPCALSLPRRILVPWLANVCICDYLQPSETFEVVKDHCKELMSMESPDTSRILEPEREAISLTTGSFWDVVQSVSQSTTTESERDLNLEGGSKEPLKQTTRSTVISILILLLAILVGLVYFGLDRKNSVQ
ncbi:hypothetical protein GIB67_003270 [Kingdonia uniflora]|uniref:Uncharacterized protein n=1 Tax=Kingdonia uniflora TaxID=39325 RepID=A0A7J7LXS4_9MAGN|nr:hypothetical protein GIB67_003270 [Kingdonia uniflora]